jgi:hypothetical protein
MSSGEIKPAFVLDVAPATLAEARARCAARAETRGHAAEAARYRDGTNDQGWALRYEAELIGKEQVTNAGGSA